MAGCSTYSEEKILAAKTPNLPFMIKNSLKADRHRNIMLFNKMCIEFFITSWNVFIFIESSLEDFSCVSIYISVDTLLQIFSYYGASENATLQDFIDPLYLDKFLDYTISAKKMIKKGASKDTPIWIGETASTYGGGAESLSDRFAAGFL